MTGGMLARRQALGLFGAGLAAGALAATPVASADPVGPPLIPRGRIGIQLYSVRDKSESLGFRAVLAEVSRIGFREVEFARLTQGAAGPITPEQLRQLLDDNGLRAVGRHVSIAAFRTNLERELDISEILGTPYIGTANEPVPPARRTVAGYQAAAAEFNSWGQAAAARGMKWYHHNHRDEFRFAADQPDVRLYDVLLAETDPRYVYLQMDILWAYAGRLFWPGFEPVDYILAQPRRYPLFHLKDGVLDPTSPTGYVPVEFGAGDLPYAALISTLRSAAPHHWIWEQDTAPNTTPNPPGSFGAAARSYAAIRDCGRLTRGRTP